MTLALHAFERLGQVPQSSVRAIERISIELTQRCDKACSFCYNGSSSSGGTSWTLDDLVGFVKDCSMNGTKAVSLGGGEPLQFEALFDLLAATRGVLFRSMTTNGLLLTDAVIHRLSRVGIEKVHVSIHFPSKRIETERAIRLVQALESSGIRAGVNMLVRHSEIEPAMESALKLRNAGIGNDRIVYLPMRGQDTPTPEEVARVAGREKFQSMTCLARCAASARFCSIDAQRGVGWCSYTQARRQLRGPTHAALIESLELLQLKFCGNAP